MDIRRRIVTALLLLLIVATVAVIGYLLLGGPSVTLLDAVYMAVITLSGVGYSEVVDTSHSPALRVFNLLIVLFGVAITVYVFSVMTAFLVGGELRDLFRRRRMRKEIDQLKGHYIVCGLGETGRQAIEELQSTHADYTVIESSEEVIHKLQSHASGAYKEMLYIVGDATDEAVLRQAGLDHARGLIAALPGDKDNLVITVIVRQQSPKVRIVSRYTDLSFSKRMLKAGANATVSPNRIGGLRLASEVLRPHVVRFLDLMLQEKSDALRIDQIDIAEGSGWIGKTIGDLNLRSRYNLLPLALEEKTKTSALTFNPSETTALSEGTVIIVMGAATDLHRARSDAERS